MPGIRCTLCLGLLFAVNFTAQDVFGETLLVSQNNNIWSLTTSSDALGLSPQAVLSADLPVRAFDIHLAWRQVYWATDYSIYRTPLYDRQTTTLVGVTGRVVALSVDWVQHRLYWAWTDDLRTAGRIEASHLDGRGRRVVYETPSLIIALALDPQIGKIFWIESIQEGRKLKNVKSCNLDGSQVKTIYSNESISDRSPLALDLSYRSLYFYKALGDLSEQWEINYDGIEPFVKLFEREEAPPRSLALTKHGFFYCNRDGLFRGNWTKRFYDLVVGENVYSYMVLDPNVEPLGVENLREVGEVRVWSDSLQPPAQDRCRSRGCERECIPLARGDTRCLCDFGHSLAEDRHTCSDHGYVIFSTKTLFGRYKLNGQQPTILYNYSTANVHVFDVHHKSKHIYWSDLYYGNIYRAPVENPTRKEVVVSGVAAYGVAVDWVHGHLYWTDHSRLMISPLDGSLRIILLKNLDAPADIVVDPVNRFVFWAECGLSQSIQRASLDGGDVTLLVDHVTCGASLAADPANRALFWVEWAGQGVWRCGLGGSRCSLLYREVDASTLRALVGRGLLWTPVWEESPTTGTGHSPSYIQLDVRELNIEAKGLKVMTSRVQPAATNVCEETECAGLCLPRASGAEPLCLCEGRHHHGHPCHTLQPASTQQTPTDHRPEAYLEVMSLTPFSVTLRCAGSLRTHPVLRPYIYLTEVDSLVPRPRVTPTRSVQVGDKELPFTIDQLNPATTYNVSVRNRVTKNSFSLKVHTPPPPLKVKRLPLLYLPGVTDPVSWLAQGVHYSSPNCWEDLLVKELFVLLISKNKFSSNHGMTNETLLDLFKENIKDHFIILNHYKSKEQFDDDPALYLGNVPWGEEFEAAVAQVTWYQGASNLDLVFSQPFYLPDPQWTPLIREIKRNIEDSDLRVD